ncbi:uncharacterized protein UTRI_03393_B [Ustilago trichophora]|uniref:WD40 repeat-like protein n=1 Tax=Ustilago trichophora TaxID=86804 RepID=A0A5C3E0W3_9BASI|nr:uncharacterized protein UTRI_03393_B [Ustilago trichophora]
MAFLHSANFDPSPRRTISSSRSHHRQCQLDDYLIDRLDNTEVLGGEDSSGLHIGHIGCVNALSWSPSGQLLASGSDDRNVILWKLGSPHTHPLTHPSQPIRSRTSASSRYAIGASRRAREQPTQTSTSHDTDSLPSESAHGLEHQDDDIVQPWPQRSFPKMELGMLGNIETGHRANIFSVKWAPNASERRLFTCAGDSHVRVFDINYMSSSTGEGADGQVHRSHSGSEWHNWSEHSGACIRLFRCHRGRAKRISTEVSPDVFLTCGEDGDVRQMDLRVPHTCRTRTGGSCPPPLAHYPSVLYSLSVSKLEPWLFAVAGESSLAYLHDRRMIPRLIKREWGMSTDAQHDALTMCVRSFGVPPGGFDAPWADNDGRTALRSEESPSSRRRLFMGNRNSITACKLSEHNGRDLLVSYSSGHIYRFDIYDEPGVLHANLDNVRFSLDTDQRSQSPEGEAAATEAVDKPKARDNNDIEMGDGKSRGGREGNEDENVVISGSDADDAGTAGENDDGRNVDVEDSEHEGSSDYENEEEEDEEQEQEHLDEDEDENDNENEDEDENDNENEDEDEDEDEDASDDDRDDDDAGDMSEEDLMHLLQQEAGLRSTSPAEPVVPTVYPRSAYKGHCNKETVKDVAFAGGDDEYVISGSDDGNWFMWDKLTSEIKGIWHGDSSVVNVMAMHPDLPVFAISGIDDTIKIFAPISITPFPPPAADQDEGAEASSTESRRRRPRLGRDDAIRAHKLTDRLPDKDDICQRNERQLQRDSLVTPAASILWRLHPRLLGIDVDDDPDRQAEGDCIVM